MYEERKGNVMKKRNDGRADMISVIFVYEIIHRLIQNFTFYKPVLTLL